MLKVMRDSFQHLKWILVFVVFVFILFTFIEWGGAGDPGAGGQQVYAARVNGQTITLQDFDRAMFYTAQRYEQMYGQKLTPDMVESLGLPRQVLNSLIDQRLLLQQARDLGLEASAEEVRKRIHDIPQLNPLPEKKFVGAELYRRFVTTNLGYASPAEFEEDLADEITLGKIENAFASAVVLTPKLIEEEYRRRTENAKVRYVIYPAQQFVKEVSVTPAEVEAHYAANRSRYTHPEQRDVKYLLAEQSRLRGRIAVDEAMLRKHYQSSREDFKTGESVKAQHILIKTEPGQDESAARSRAESILNQIRTGKADFAALAREHSGDPGSAARGGDLGWFERGRMVPEFEQVAFSLQPGQVSDLVKTQYGFHIIKVTERRPAGYKPFEEVRRQIERQLTNDLAKEQARERMATIRARIDQMKTRSGKTLDAMTDDVVSVNSTKWFGKTDVIPGVGRSQELADWAFSAKPGDFGPVIQTARGPLVPYLEASRPAGTFPLSEIRQRVETDAKLVEARQAALEKARAALAPGRSLDEVASSLGLKAQERTISRGAPVAGLTGNLEPLIREVFNAQVGQIRGPFVVDQGAVVVQVTEQNRYDPKTFDTTRESFIQNMRTTEAAKIRAAMLAKLRTEAEIEINESLVAPQNPAAQQPPVTGL